MKQFVCLEDVESSRLPLALGTLVEHVLTTELSIAKTPTLAPDEGAVFLLEKADTDQTLIEQFGRPFPEILFECIQHVVAADAYLCRWLRNNECVVSLVIPDRRWLPEAWRKTIELETGQKGVKP